MICSAKSGQSIPASIRGYVKKKTWLVLQRIQRNTLVNKKNNLRHLEHGNPIEPTICDCCSGRSVVVYGYLYKDNDAHAIYYCGWNTSHKLNKISIAIGIGNWDEDAIPEDERRAYFLECTITQGSIEFEFIEPKESPWKESRFLGRPLNAAIAKHSNERYNIFKNLDFIFKNDVRIKTHIDELSV